MATPARTLRAAPLRVCPEAWAGLGWTYPHSEYHKLKRPPYRERP